MTDVPADDRLLPYLLERIASSDLGDPAGLLVLAAYEGDDALADALEGVAEGRRPAVPTADPVHIPHAYLQRVTVAGFRGVGPESSLDLQPGPGLTLVVGRNGSGKSSFAEAAEIALTGANARWRARSSVWREGWRNLHRGDSQPSVQVELQVDGEQGTTRVAREW